MQDRLVRRFQSTTEREAEGRKKGYSGTLEADLWRSEAKIEALAHPTDDSSMSYRRGINGEIIEEEKDEIPKDKEEGLNRWRKQIELMFLHGDDTDFDYPKVDGSEEYDDRAVEEREAEESWFAQQEPEWAVDDDMPSAFDRKPQGQTGVQDF